MPLLQSRGVRSSSGVSAQSLHLGDKLEIAGSNPASTSNTAWVAQSVERRLEKPCVDGSTPSPCTTTTNIFNHFRKFNETKTKTPGHTKSLRRVGHAAKGWIASQTEQSDTSSREGEHSWGCSSKAEHSVLTDRQGFDSLHPHHSIVVSDSFICRFRECFAPVA